MKTKISLSATQLKYIAILAMTLDHVAFAFMPYNSLAYYIMRGIGKITAPTMSFFIAEGFNYTKNRKKYLFRVLFFAFISQPFYYFMKTGERSKSFSEFITFNKLNVLFGFAISIIILFFISNKKMPLYARIIFLLLCLMASDHCDWSFIIPSWVIVFYLFRNNKKIKILFFSFISIVFLTERYILNFNSFIEFSYMYGVMLALILISMYNGKRNNHNNIFFKKIDRWIFYIYYPLHMAIITIIKCLT